MCLINHRATTEIHSTRSLWLLPWDQEQVCFLSATTIPFCCIIWRQHPSNQRYEWQHSYNNINISIEWYALSYSLSTKTSTKKHADYPFSYWIQKRPREISVIYAIHTWYTDFNQGDWRSSSIQHAYIVLWSTNYTGEGAFSKTQQKHPAWLWSHQYQRTTHLHKTTHLSCCGETLRKLSWSSSSQGWLCVLRLLLQTKIMPKLPDFVNVLLDQLVSITLSSSSSSSVIDPLREKAGAGLLEHNDTQRNREIVRSSLTSILLLLLKWFKLSRM